MIILVDGFIMTNCVLAASKMNPEILNYCIFGHQGDEAGHKLLLEYLEAKPVLNLGLRLGEGTGALCAYPVIESAVRMINEMNSFKKIQVTKYF
jgi:nicotinate-nucleotide--dimethylbenzimidazole phosphoribosyltransferase